MQQMGRIVAITPAASPEKKPTRRPGVGNRLQLAVAAIFWPEEVFDGVLVEVFDVADVEEALAAEEDDAVMVGVGIDSPELEVFDSGGLELDS